MERSEALLEVGRLALERIHELAGEDATELEPDLRKAIDEATSSPPGMAEPIRDVLRRNPGTRAFMEERHPELRKPLKFGGGRRFSEW